MVLRHVMLCGMRYADELPHRRHLGPLDGRGCISDPAKGSNDPKDRRRQCGCECGPAKAGPSMGTRRDLLDERGQERRPWHRPMLTKPSLGLFVRGPRKTLHRRLQSRNESFYLLTGAGG